ncbi:MAG: NifB/NifX family molybdenum-iron cluster-binding protein [Proteobacteria bacterium]|nr:dinitrogenase iron-molybdenum cofactor biosynthesis domain-containing protein [Desulfobacula sp.]MBU3953464.1 NifB/NifX family molybdenum-iron cluster-binding protein [Pseudomonadota bacterium]MBU4132195.1 NifB/NifX family molybdenum-iron cluster-binding protein [Pseudomonadota bacterium]
MKIAIPIWGNRISPVFDSARTLLVARIENRKIAKKTYTPFDPECCQDLIRLLQKMQITTLICGAISTKPADFLVENNIKLISFVTGNAMDFLDYFASRQTIEKGHMMPGCSMEYCRRRKHIQP